MLRLEGLIAGYDGGQVLRGVDLAVEQGSIVAVLGRNGAGKTTLLRTVMGLVAPAGGRIRFAGRDIAGRRPYQISNLGIAYVPQGREIFADFTVEENLLLGVLGKPGRPAIAASVYDDFPILAARRNQVAGSLSGGEQQQLAIARALAGRPRLLLLDEPSEGLQPSIVEQIGETLQAVAAREGLTVLLVEQNVDMVAAVAGRCLFLERGRVVAQHPAAELRRSDDLLRRYLAL